MTALSVLAAGPGSTIQDGGRHGFLRYGVTGAGPMDPFAHALANRALGNPAGAAAIEVSLGGLEVTAEGGPVAVALAGGAFAVTLDGQALPPAVVAMVEPGAKLKLRAGQAGAWCYLAVPGGFDVPQVLGSAATHTRTGIGGIAGRGLMAGDRLAIAGMSPAEVETGEIVAPLLERPAETIRVILGPQDDYFAPDQIAAFLAGPWTISARGDRMACFLEGPKLTHVRGYNIASDGIAMGAIQVPGEGQPIVLMADRQSTGGYPKVATVIGPDLGRLAQARPGSTVSFRAVTHAEAVAARAAEHAFLSAAIPVEPLIRRHFPSEFLLGLNLIDGWVDARQPA
ncbi:biotin-dependent carboxyltransferase family protein [Bosea sp. F3-2]|uniref:5-oxoprolinase subunit C family protein n=1 Tax=Bosea sp. F3-2 TaxID=2599640 RepID=UPI0011ED2763|nr:biotin-dependent carboxyltransferase family protein [Bosea sp. F3-2]QEL22497.1 biotin-dependent carboxyltransferase family protein [Bosea sp. F3-2]